MVLTVDQVAERLSLTPRHIRDMLRAGVLPGFKRGIRSWGVLLVEFEKWLSSRGNRNPAGTAK